ncbi:MAG: TniB family NTP-binding protein [Candidatus Pristimantibacillus sp.]
MVESNNNHPFVRRLLNLNIEHPQITTIYKIFESMMKRPGKTRHLFIMGSSNVGKSTLAEKFLEKHPEYTDVDEEGTEIDKRPVILVEIPHPFTLKEFYYEVLDSLGTPRLSGRPEINDLKVKAYNLINKQEVKLIIFDEINNILTSSINNKTAMDAIKQMANKTKVPLVLMGTPDSVKLREEDEQYKSRYRPKALKRFEECDDEFCSFLKKIEEKIDPPKPLYLWNDQTAQLLHYMSKGKVGYITPLLIEAFSLLGVFEKDFDDFDKLTFNADLLDKAYEIILGDALDDDLEKESNKLKNYNSSHIE